MVMAGCRECGKDVSEEASVCPACGVNSPTPAAARRRERRRRAVAIPLTVLAVVLLLLVGNWWLDRQARLDSENGLRACREQLVADGYSPSDPAFDLAVAMCNINRE